jgi:uncharacterized protein (DUF433 family)
MTPETLQDVSERYEAGESTEMLAEDYNVNPVTIRKWLDRTDTPRRKPAEAAALYQRRTAAEAEAERRASREQSSEHCTCHKPIPARTYLGQWLCLRCNRFRPAEGAL